MQAYAVNLPNGNVGIIRLTPLRVIDRADFDDDESYDLHVEVAAIRQARKLPKTLFELSRTSDRGHFDPLIHTLATIEVGLTGHLPLVSIEIDDETDLPNNLDQRDNWEIFEGKVRVKPA